MEVRSHVSPDVFLHVPASLALAGEEARTNIPPTTATTPTTTPTTTTATTVLNVVFFITGNPGLIAYYHPFLAGLVRGFSSPVVVAGFSLGGFEVEDWFGPGGTAAGAEAVRRGGGGGGREESMVGRSGKSTESESESVDDDEDEQERERERESLRDLLFLDPTSLTASSSEAIGARRRISPSQKIYTLTEQIELCYARLENLVTRLREQYKVSQGLGRGDTTKTRTGGLNIKVTLVGHSVGAYIALELVRIWYERRRLALNGPESLPSPTTTTTTTTAWTIPSAILLTPTIQDLHLSSSGRVASPLLTYMPFLPGLAHGLVQDVLVKLLPASWLETLVRRFTGMQAGSHGLVATVAFLRSRRGVRQALEMARLELREIRGDSWGEEVWGVVGGGADEESRPGMKGLSPSPRLYFWFAKQDHWVADVTREEILKTRAIDGFVEREDDLGHGDGIGSVDHDGRTPRIRIDETDGLVHAWCLTQSELVTRRVSGWLQELWNQEGGE